MPEPRTRPERPDSREVAALKQVKAEQPDLCSAVDLQLELAGLHRRMQTRMSTPWIDVDAVRLAEQQQGIPLLRFADVPLDWGDVRFVCRQTADLLFRYEALDRDDHDRIQAVVRHGNTLEPLIRRWFNSKVELAGAAPEPQDADGTNATPAIGVTAEALDQVFSVAMRPFLARCAELLTQRHDFSGWMRAYCPLCGGDPEMAVITQSADRRLICGRCTAQWLFHPLTCPFCQNDDRHQITSFASRGGRYRIYACDVCRRYLKAFDARHADRAVMLSVDSVATLPLDAAAIQKGYLG